MRELKERGSLSIITNLMALTYNKNKMMTSPTNKYKKIYKKRKGNQHLIPQFNINKTNSYLFFLRCA